MKFSCSLTILLILIRFSSIGQIYKDSIIDIHAHFWEMSKSADQYFKENKDLKIKTGGIVIIQKQVT